MQLFSVESRHRSSSVGPRHVRERCKTSHSNVLDSHVGVVDAVLAQGIEQASHVGPPGTEQARLFADPSRVIQIKVLRRLIEGRGSEVENVRWADVREFQHELMLVGSDQAGYRESVKPI